MWLEPATTTVGPDILPSPNLPSPEAYSSYLAANRASLLHQFPWYGMLPRARSLTPQPSFIHSASPPDWSTPATSPQFSSKALPWLPPQEEKRAFKQMSLTSTQQHNTPNLTYPKPCAHQNTTTTSSSLLANTHSLTHLPTLACHLTLNPLTHTHSLPHSLTQQN